MRDDIFNKNIDLVDFSFDKNVVKVFDDMVRRSVPGYQNILEMIKLIATNYAQKNTNLYDLGCSTGATSLALSGIKNTQIIGVDNSIAMLDKCQNNLQNIDNIQYICDDIANIEFKNASVVVLNLTLQFVAKDKRSALIDKIYQGLNKGGVLFIAEKVHFESPQTQDFFTNLHLKFKRENGYSELEIANKRQLLDDVLITDTPQIHLQRLSQLGFCSAKIITQNLNFYGFIAIK